MKIQDLRQDLDILKDKERTSGESNEWLISYSDLVTVLLCFFILFFVIKAKQQEKDFLQTISKKAKKELILSDVNNKIKNSNLTSRAQLQKFERHLSIMLKNKAFKPGGELTLEGQLFLTELASIVYPFMPHVQLQISIGEKKSGLESENMSKAIQARKFLSELGLNQELVSIGSYTRSPASLEEHETDEIRVFISQNYLTGNHEK